MTSSRELRAYLLTALGLALPSACSQTVNGTDAAAPDAPADAPPDAPLDVVDAAVDAPPDRAEPVCPGTSRRECLTETQVEARIRNPPGKIPPPDGGTDDVPIDAPRASNGCYVAGALSDDCCIRASAVEREGDTCCYTFCTGACCGRPFAVDGAARAAALVDGGAWCDGAAPLDGLDAVTRDALASAWRRDALMEHASVASFARFTLHLMAHGAPPSLVAAAQRAALDEVDHARLCFALAAALDGRAMGPGPLDVGGALGAMSLADCVRAAVAEGCVGETCAALVARERCEGARDPAVRAALDRIARDESEHAALAWRFVAWAIEAGGDEAREAARQAFDEARRARVRGAEVPAGIDAAAWRAHGMLTAREEERAMRAALDEVVAPCARAVLAAPAADARIRGDGVRPT